MRALVEKNEKNLSNIPPIDVILADGVRDIAIKISDQGGGIPRSHMNRIWSMSFVARPSKFCLEFHV